MRYGKLCLFLFLVLLFYAERIGHAETMYVSDRLYLSLRNAPEPGQPARDLLPSDTQVDVLETKGKWARVRLEDGRTGWVWKRYLVRDVPKSLIIKKLKRQIQETEITMEKFRAEIASRDREIEALKTQITRQKDRFQVLAKENASKRRKVLYITGIITLAIGFVAGYLARRRFMAGREILFIAMILLLSPFPTPGQDQGRELVVEFNRGLLTLSVENVNLKHVLTAVAGETGMSVWYPRDLKKPITAEFNDLPLRQGLRRILRGMNYALIYSPFTTEKTRGEVLAGVYVLSKQRSRFRQAFRPSTRLKSPEERRAAAIESYRRRLDVLEQQVVRFGMDSPRGKAIQRQIRQFERKIEKLIQQ